jgi:hypothetical protein
VYRFDLQPRVVGKQGDNNLGQELHSGTERLNVVDKTEQESGHPTGKHTVVNQRTVILLIKEIKAEQISNGKTKDDTEAPNPGDDTGVGMVVLDIIPA